ncbi:hypothetical protein ES703_00819 [subsurface metagenome]
MQKTEIFERPWQKQSQKQVCQYCGKRHRSGSRIGLKHSSPLCQQCQYKECFLEEYTPGVGWGYGGHAPGEHGFCFTYERYTAGEISLDRELTQLEIEELFGLSQSRVSEILGMSETDKINISQILRERSEASTPSENPLSKRCPICASALEFDGERTVCRACPYVERGIAGGWRS